MRVWVGLLAFASIASILIIPGASALNFTDNTGSGFGSGTHVNTTADPLLGLTLGNETAQSYNQSGSFMSRTFDAEQIVRWDSSSLNATANASEHLYSILFAASNSSSWGSFTTLPQMGRYLNYSITMSSANNQTRPVIDLVNITYSFILPQSTPVSPASNYVTTVSSITLNCSAASVNGLKNISMYWNQSAWSANVTNETTGFFNYTTLSLSGFPAGAYTWACLAYDNQSNMAWGPNRTVYYASDTAAPAISSYNISVPFITTGSSVSFSMYAADSNLQSVWINISYPNSSTVRLGLTNGGVASFTPPVIGVYNVTFFANDTSGNTSNASSSFTAVAPLPVNLSVTGRNNASLASNVTFYYAGTSTQAAFYSSSTGNYGTQAAPNTSCDISVNAYDGRVNIMLLGVETQSNTNRIIVLDNPNVSGFIAVYAVNSSYSMGSARVRISYSGINVSSEGTLKMQKCANWSFAASSCSGSWADVTPIITDTDANYIQADVSGFSAYGLIQGGYCGDGVCSSNEGPINCTLDCTCNNGDTRACSVARRGQCAIGTEVCTGGAWTGCPLPAAELCNQIDDDCDGVIDNVNGAASVEAAGCQCYNSGRPVPEACNGIDDDCNGQVDDGIQSQCGSNIGACAFGLKTCVNGIFTNCTGGILPASEICGNNIDDDCDGQVDEGCASNAPCPWGAINESGCRCGNQTYTGGYCCSGSYQTEPCVRLPWELLIIFGVMGAVAGLVVHVTRKRNRRTSWEELEKKYTPV